MADTRTIILGTDGRLGTLGRGDSVEIGDDQIRAAAEQGIRGWVAIQTGSFYAKRAPKLARVHAVNGATDAEWDAAVAAYLATHAAQ